MIIAVLLVNTKIAGSLFLHNELVQVVWCSQRSENTYYWYSWWAMIFL